MSILAANALRVLLQLLQGFCLQREKEALMKQMVACQAQEASDRFKVGVNYCDHFLAPSHLLKDSNPEDLT